MRKPLGLQWFVILPILVYLSCSSLDKASRQIKWKNLRAVNSPVIFVARQTDTLNSSFAFRENGHFEFWLKSSPARKSKLKYFTGQYSEQGDTIFLQFYKSIAPENMVKYVIMNVDKRQLQYPNTNIVQSKMYQLQFKNEKLR